MYSFEMEASSLVYIHTLIYTEPDFVDMLSMGEDKSVCTLMSENGASLYMVSYNRIPITMLIQHHAATLVSTWFA